MSLMKSSTRVVKRGRWEDLQGAAEGVPMERHSGNAGREGAESPGMQASPSKPAQHLGGGLLMSRSKRQQPMLF